MKNTISKAMPLLLTILGAIVFGSIVINKGIAYGFSIEGLFFVATITLYVLWMIWESRVSVRELEKDNLNSDKYTMEFAAVSKMTLLITALIYSPAPTLKQTVIGIAIMLLGISMRMGAISKLGKRYSHRIRKPVLPLEEGGIYGYIRHPAYMGTWIIHLGFVLVFANIWSIMALFCLWLPAVLIRTIVEERYLKEFQEYKFYAMRVKTRLIPYVW